MYLVRSIIIITVQLYFITCIIFSFNFSPWLLYLNKITTLYLLLDLTVNPLSIACFAGARAGESELV
jgi:hypothetical protein